MTWLSQWVFKNWLFQILIFKTAMQRSSWMWPCCTDWCLKIFSQWVAEGCSNGFQMPAAQKNCWSVSSKFTKGSSESGCYSFFVWSWGIFIPFREKERKKNLSPSHVNHVVTVRVAEPIWCDLGFKQFIYSCTSSIKYQVLFNKWRYQVYFVESPLPP